MHRAVRPVGRGVRPPSITDPFPPKVAPRRFSRALIGLVALGTGADAVEKPTIGWVERVAIAAAGGVMEAKVDTGADHSSVAAAHIRHFERQGTPWVEFRLRDEKGRSTTLERPLARWARIKKKTGGVQQRPVVMLDLCVGGTRRLTEVNLADRVGFKYPFLLGRDFLQGHFLVDAGVEYSRAPTCD